MQSASGLRRLPLGQPVDMVAAETRAALLVSCQQPPLVWVLLLLLLLLRPLRREMTEALMLSRKNSCMQSVLEETTGAISFLGLLLLLLLQLLRQAVSIGCMPQLSQTWKNCTRMDFV